MLIINPLNSGPEPKKNFKYLITWWKEKGYWNRQNERLEYMNEKKKKMEEYNKKIKSIKN